MTKKLGQLGLVAMLGLLPLGVPVGVSVSHASLPALSGIFGAKPKFLPVTQAFNVTANQANGVLTVRFRVTPEHYVYKDKLKLTLPDGVQMGTWQFDSTPSMIDDPEFGRVAVFERDVVATTTLTTKRAIAGEMLKLTWQGCAKAGLCYPPETLKLELSLDTIQAHVGQGQTPPTEPAKDDKTQAPNPQPIAKTAPKTTPKTTLSMDGMDDLTLENGLADGGVGNGQDLLTSSSTVGDALLSSSLQGGTNTIGQGVAMQNGQLNGQLIVNAGSNLSATSPQDSNQDPSQHLSQDLSQNPTQELPQNPALAMGSNIAQYPLNHTPQAVNSYGFGLDKNPILAIGLLFLAGIALAFTACVYPMIPIVANIVAKSHKPTAMRGFILTGAYGLGVATSYGLLGAVVAWFGQGLGIVGWLQNRWILTVFALLFVLFALQMIGAVKIGLPASLKVKLSRHAMLADRHLGRVWGSFVVGMLSALVVSPCVSAPMAGALAGVSASNNVALGFGALFALGLGLSVPLMVMGTLEGKFMPKAGVWMEYIKQFASLMLLAVGLVLLDRAWGSSWVLVLWAVWFALLSLFFWQLARAWRVLAMVAGAWVCVLMMGVGMGANDVLRPLHPMTDKPAVSQLPDMTVTSLAELDGILKTTPKVLVDVTAEWCVECRIMERTLFANRPAVMADWQVVRLDITETSDKSQAILKRYQLFGPPALLYYQQGQLLQVQVGEVSRSDFEMALHLQR